MSKGSKSMIAAKGTFFHFVLCCSFRNLDKKADITGSLLLPIRWMNGKLVEGDSTFANLWRDVLSSSYAALCEE